jgi:hypothetical protein
MPQVFKHPLFFHIFEAYIKVTIDTNDAYKEVKEQIEILLNPDNEYKYFSALQ